MNSSSNNNNNNNSGSSSNNNTNGSHSENNKKEEFRRYLEKTGVMDALIKVLVGLYEEPERPQHAVEYVRRYLGAPQNVDVEGLKRENEQLRQELEKLRKSGSNKKGSS